MLVIQQISLHAGNSSPGAPPRRPAGLGCEPLWQTVPSSLSSLSAVPVLSPVVRGGATWVTPHPCIKPEGFPGLLLPGHALPVTLGGHPLSHPAPTPIPPDPRAPSDLTLLFVPATEHPEPALPAVTTQK